MSQIAELANLVHTRLQKPRKLFGATITDGDVLTPEVLSSLFDTLFFGSIKTEEGRSPQIKVFYINPENPDPDEPTRIRKHRWRIFPLAEHIAFSVPNIVKLSKAADPWSSGLAVFHTAVGQLFIWGMVDQVTAISMAVVQEASGTFPPPGIFHAVLSGPADITVYRQSSFVARLAQDLLIDSQNDCLWVGSVSDTVDEWFASIWDEVAAAAGKRALAYQRDEMRYAGKQLWTSTLCRILLSIQRQRHGGAILISRSHDRDLSIKYGLSYERVGEAMREVLYTSIRVGAIHWRSEWRRLDGKNGQSRREQAQKDYLQSTRDDAVTALTGAIRFISSLAGVDGLVLATPDFDVVGFGVEIMAKSDVPTVNVSRSPYLTDAVPVASSHYGTRHRSMFRYIADHPGSLGFVVSQDGDVRAVIQAEGKVYMFDNVKLHALWDDDLPKRMKGIKFRKRSSKK